MIKIRLKFTCYGWKKSIDNEFLSAKIGKKLDNNIRISG